MLALSAFFAYAAPMKVHLLSSVASPQPVGTVVTVFARVENPSRGTHTYRFSVSMDGGVFHILRDFSQQDSWAWSPDLYEHAARIRVTARNNETKETVEAEIPFRVMSRIRNSQPVVTPTAHPLVALFSAPACPSDSEFRVAFQSQYDAAPVRTPAEPCGDDRSKNAYVAGMRADTDYRMRAEIVSAGSVKASTWLPFHTGMIDGRFPPLTTVAPHPPGDLAAERLLVRSIVDPRNIATDLDGNIVWYTRDAAFLTRMLSRGRFLALAEGVNAANDMRRLQLLREIDLLGNAVRETNVARVAEQLQSRGIRSECKQGSQECASGFHHEAIRLPNDHTLVIAGLERVFPAGTQGAKEPVDIIGDLVIDLDPEFQVAWIWNSFDHMDVSRASRSGNLCNAGPGQGGCPPVFLAPSARNWLHSNALHYVRGSGDLLMSMPEQDWVVKIDYKDGTGSGKVLWRLGEGGDFTARSDDPHPWFSFQHDAGFDPATNLLLVFDNGTRRKEKDSDAKNRGQAWNIDERNRIASLVLNAPVGVYAIAVGSAQRLADGDFSFESGFIPGPVGRASISSRTTEVSPEGKITYSQQADGVLTYRSFRVPDLYTAPAK